MKRLVLVTLLALAAAPAAAQTIYRWVDDQGVVNYGSAPPRGVASERVQARDQISVYTPAPLPRAARGTAAAQPARAASPAEEKLLRQRRAREEQLAALELQRRQRCLAQRRVDCDDPLRAEGDGGFGAGFVAGAGVAAGTGTALDSTGSSTPGSTAAGSAALGSADTGAGPLDERLGSTAATGSTPSLTSGLGGATSLSSSPSPGAPAPSSAGSPVSSSAGIGAVPASPSAARAPAVRR